MAEPPAPGFGDLIGVLSGANPLPAIAKTIDQFKRGVNDFLNAVENFNKTMETINSIATRANDLFEEIEEPIRLSVAQVARSITTADAVIKQVSGPIEKVAPGISRLADTLASPVFASMPTDIAGFLDTLGDVARRLQPLGQMAENASSMFGLRSFASLLGGSSPVPSSPPPGSLVAEPPPPPPPPRKPAVAKRLVPKKAAAQRAAPKKSAARKSAAKISPARGATPKRAAAKKVPR